MNIEYQGKKLVPIEEFIKEAVIIPGLEEMIGNGEALVVGPREAFFDFQGSEENYYFNAVYRWDGNFPRFLTYLKSVVDENRKIIRYETTLS